MNENRRGAQKSKAYGRRRKSATGREGGDGRKEADDDGSCDGVKQGSVAKERLQAKFAAIAKHDPDQRNQHRMNPSEPQQKTVAALPKSRRQRFSGRQELPKSLQESRWGASCKAFRVAEALTFAHTVCLDRQPFRRLSTKFCWQNLSRTNYFKLARRALRQRRIHV